MSYLRVNNVSFRYPSVNYNALTNITLDLPLGEIIAIIGQNGAGKTTLAKILIGLLHPTSGSVEIDNEQHEKFSIAELATKIGYVYQNPNIMLFSDTVEKELFLSLQTFPLTKLQKTEKVTDMLEFFNLTTFKDHHPRLLSRGQKQKLALASILIKDPSVLIFDEPFSGIDFKQRDLIISYINELKLRNKLILLISHNLDLILKNSDRTIALQKGKLISNSPTKTFFSDPKIFEKITLGLSPMLQLIYNLHECNLPESILTPEALISFFSEKKTPRD
ncbi:MAG: ABC transporter ATP-binding protein [Asgard group archaeon]|nr:ABC transporter ATP-binding protein [Asgard group archaeon]